MIVPPRPGLFPIDGRDHAYYFDGVAWTTLRCSAESIERRGQQVMEDACERQWPASRRDDSRYVASRQATMTPSEFEAWSTGHAAAIRERDRYALAWSNEESARQRGDRPPSWYREESAPAALPSAPGKSAARPWVIAAVVVGVLIAIFIGGRAVGFGATARCGDGTFSYSQHAPGTCSWHDGVAAWLNSGGSSVNPADSEQEYLDDQDVGPASGDR